jgi:hypothetical protein
MDPFPFGMEAAMKSHLSFPIIMLVASMLACTLPTEGDPLGEGQDKTTLTHITGMDMEPPSGTGSTTFQLVVTYESFYQGFNPPGDISCSYITPNGITKGIGKISVARAHEDKNKMETHTKSLPFNVRQADGKTTSGKYKAQCANEYTTSPLSVDFFVSESAAQPPQPPSDPATPPPAKPLLAAPLKGRIIFDYAKAESTLVGHGGELDEVTKWCPVVVTIASDGRISGECEYKGTAFIENATVTANVTGMVDPSGNVTFSYDVTEVGVLSEKGNPIGSWRISYQGHGKFTPPDHASGSADFGYNCNSNDENRKWCFSQTSESFSGSIPWSFVPSQ